MRLVHRYLSLSRGERTLVVSTLSSMLFVRFALLFVPADTVRRGTGRIPDRFYPDCAGDPPSARRLAWAVRAVSRFVPRSSCLVRAIVTERLLTRYDHPSRFRIGVSKEGPELVAHAWVESNGTIIVGNVEDLSRFQPLPHT